MKKFFGLLACLFLLMGCDDGEMMFDTFNFSGATPQECGTANNTYIFVNSSTKEVLVVTFPANALLNTETEKAPFQVNNIQYRVYEGATPSQSNICGAIDNPGLTVKELWTGSGTVTVITTRVETEEGVVTFRHAITLNDVSFNKEGETIRILDNYLGELSKPLGFEFDFAEDDSELRTYTPCSTGKYVTTDATEGLIVDIGDTVLPNTVIDTPLQFTNQNSENNISVSFVKYNGNVTPSILCSGNVLTPNIVQKWTTANNGRLIIRTIAVPDTSPTEYAHLLYLEDTVFFNNLSNGESFTPTSNIAEGPYEGMYYIGRIVE